MSKNTIISLRSKNKITMLAILALLGVLLMVFAKCTSESEPKSETSSPANLDPSLYAAEIEKKVEELCNKIEGVHSTHAVVSLECGYRAIYATDSQSGANSSKHETVIVGNGSSQKALLIGYENPEIAGIGIVCSGGDDARVREQIVSIVSSAFNIPTNKIFVSGS
jgi:stage III sporulation protein AG